MPISKARYMVAVVALALGAAPTFAADLAASVAAKLRESGSLSGYNLNVKAKAGTVWLEGRVADEKQLAAAMSLAETTPGVERVVNRLVIQRRPAATEGRTLNVPDSAWSVAGMARPDRPPVPPSQPDAAGREGVQLTQAIAPATPGKSPSLFPIALWGQPRPNAPVAPVSGTRVAARTRGMPDGFALPAPAGMGGGVDGQIVPGSIRYTEGGPVEMGAGAPGMMGGGPVPMSSTGVGMPPVPMRGDGPNMPGYAWPSYAAYPNYAAVQYPTQYSPTAWPYIGPFYPYPQVPLGWRRVSLEWDDGWWWLDFDERHYHSHHR